jgi:hypothetical protein
MRQLVLDAFAGVEQLIARCSAPAQQASVARCSAR